MLNQRDKTLDEVTPVKPRKRTSESKAAEVVKTAKEPAKKPLVAKKSTVAAPKKVLAKAAVNEKAAPAPLIAQQDITREDIARLAYLLWEARCMNARAGSPEEDWVRAEALLREGSTTIS